MAVDFSNYVANAPASGIKAQTPGSATQQSLTAGTDNLTSSYSSFLKLLTAQLKNQDPTSPLDPNQFTAQIVQMTGVQQQLLTNNLLSQLVTNAQGSTGYGAVGLIGKTVQAAGSDTQLSGGQATWAYSLGAGTTTADLTVSNSSGRVVWKGKAADLSAGSHDFAWDGKDSTGAALPDGVYSLQVAAKGADGKEVAATTSISGVVTALEQANGVSQVVIGKVKVPLSAVSRVSG
ncbi:MAG: flagellar hook assembly protein FlgD [Caulobacteraceae bacterium]